MQEDEEGEKEEETNITLRTKKNYQRRDTECGQGLQRTNGEKRNDQPVKIEQNNTRRPIIPNRQQPTCYSSGKIYPEIATSGTVIETIVTI